MNVSAVLTTHSLALEACWRPAGQGFQADPQTGPPYRLLLRPEPAGLRADSFAQRALASAAAEALEALAVEAAAEGETARARGAPHGVVLDLGLWALAMAEQWREIAGGQE